MTQSWYWSTKLSGGSQVGFTFTGSSPHACCKTSLLILWLSNSCTMCACKTSTTWMRSSLPVHLRNFCLLSLVQGCCSFWTFEKTLTGKSLGSGASGFLHQGTLGGSDFSKKIILILCTGTYDEQSLTNKNAPGHLSYYINGERRALCKDNILFINFEMRTQLFLEKLLLCHVCLSALNFVLLFTVPR